MVLVAAWIIFNVVAPVLRLHAIDRPPFAWLQGVLTLVAAVSPRNRLAYGRYLATIGHCIECHTPMGPDGRRAYRTGLGAGSQVFNGSWGVSVSADITPRGLGHFSDAQLKSIITTGVLPDGMRLKLPMPFADYARMKPSDLYALVVFLRALPAR